MITIKSKIIFLGFISFFLLSCASGPNLAISPLPSQMTGINATTSYYVMTIIDKTGGGFSDANRKVLLATIQNGLRDAKMISLSKRNATHTVQISVTAYRRRNGALRFFFGAMAGGDNFNATIELHSKRTNQKIMGSIANADVSIFGSADDMVKASAIKIVEYLTGKKAKPKNEVALA